jgi:PAS domain S-box-containing protein
VSSEPNDPIESAERRRLEEERSQAEEALLESEEKFSALFSSMVEGVAIHEVVYDKSGWPIDYVITDVNPAYERITGMSRAKVVGKKASKIYGTGEPPYLDIYVRVAASGKPESFDTYFPPMEKHFSTSVFSPGKDRFATVFQDVTERKQAEEAIESLAKFPAENPYPVLRLTRDGTVLFANQASQAVLRRWGSKIGGRAPAPLRALAEEAFAKQSSVTLDIGQSEKVWSFLAVPIIDSAYANLYGRDITERKRTEDALRGSEERYRALVSAAPDAILVHRDGKVLYANSAALELYGARRLEDFASHNILEMVPLGDQEKTAERANMAVGGQKLPLRETSVVRLDGQEVPVEVVSSLVEYQGKPTVQAILRNITERQKAEQALRERERDLSRAQAVAHIGSWRLDVQRNVLDWSAESYRMFGVPPGTPLTYEGFLAFVHPEDKESVDQAWQAALAGAPYSIEHRIIVDGALKWIHEQAELDFDAKGELLGGFGTCQDITDRRRAEEALRETEERLRLAQVSAQVGVWDWNVVTGQLDFTPELNRLYGLTPGTIKTYQDWRRLAHPDDIEKTEADRDEAITNRKPFDLEFRIFHKSGETRWISAKGGAFYDNAGAPVRVLGVNIDVTDRKRAEQELRQAHERIDKLLNANILGIAEFDSTKITSANQAFLDMTGYSSKDVAQGKVDWREITAPEYAERDNRAWREMMEHGECLPYEKQYITKSGKRLPVLVARVRLTEEPVTGILLALDISEWKQMEDELVNSVHYAEHLFDTRLIGVMKSDNERILDANDAFLELVGHTRDELEAGTLRWREMTPSQWEHADRRAFAELRATGESPSYEKEYFRKDGSRVPVLVGRAVLQESPLQWVSFVLDLTERKQAEADLERMRGELLGEVSHELKTPLTAIKGCASMALSARGLPDPAEARELFEVVDSQTNRLIDLVGNLLDMTRLEAGILSVEPKDADLAAIVEEARVTFDHSRYQHPLQIELPKRLPPVHADGRRIAQVFANLFSNAAKFSPEDAPIVVSAERAGEEIVVHVRDGGPGIPGDKMPLLFRKFVQVHTTGAKGTGLGLFICKGIVEAHGGRIWAESREGEGATFSFTLPVGDGGLAAAAPQPGSKEKRTAARPARARRARVVAIDDESHILRFVEYSLTRAHYHVVSTTDPFEAPDLVKSEAPDVVLLDMRLPGTSGLEVLQKIREFSDVPVVFITATANREDVARGQQFGGTTWLEKPFSLEQLVSHVGVIVGGRNSP